MNIEKAAAAFAFEGPIRITECNKGHINGTFFVDCDSERYVLQRINRHVFPNPEQVMSNIISVTGHIRQKLLDRSEDADRGVLSFVKSGDKYYYADEDGEYWRAYRYVDGDCFQICDSPARFTHVGRAFGAFQHQLADFPADRLYEVIPHFHDTPARYAAFETAVHDDVMGRADGCREEIEFLRRRKDFCDYITSGIKEGKFPLRVTHNDTKLNNVILDKHSGRGLCVIDLDTVMPGSLLYDFGDSIRFGASPAAEDETDLSKVFVDPALFRAYTKGFLEGIEGDITDAERSALPEGARMMTYETALRFLTDYLSGDTYFRIHRPGHNLDRARNQMVLLKSMEDIRPELGDIVREF